LAEEKEALRETFSRALARGLGRVARKCGKSSCRWFKVLKIHRERGAILCRVGWKLTGRPALGEGSQTIKLRTSAGALGVRSSRRKRRLESAWSDKGGVQYVSKKSFPKWGNGNQKWEGVVNGIYSWEKKRPGVAEKA